MLPYCLMVGLFLTFASSQNLIQNGNFSTCDSSECIIPASLISPWQFSNSSNVSFSNIDGIQGLNLINSPRQNLTQMVSLQIGEIYTLSFLRYDTCLNSPSFNASGYTHVTGDVRKFFSTPYDVWYHEKRDFEAFCIFN